MQWQELVENPRQKSVDGTCGMTKTWFEGQVDSSGDTPQSHSATNREVSSSSDVTPATHLENDYLSTQVSPVEGTTNQIDKENHLYPSTKHETSQREDITSTTHKQGDKLPTDASTYKDGATQVFTSRNIITTVTKVTHNLSDKLAHN